MAFAVGDAVRWNSSNTDKEGIVVGTIGAGLHPARAGYPMLGKGSSSRGHVTYVVKGGGRGGKPALYWPLVSLLRSADGLTASEMDWCHKNAPAVRELMNR